MLANDLKAPISWTTGNADIQDFLRKLQGNILKGHGRDHTVNLFCRFRDDRKDQARAFLRTQVKRMKSARAQLDATVVKRETGKLDIDPFVCIFLTRAGYDYFGVPQNRWPSSPTFRAGMAANSDLNDPPQASWSAPLRDPHLFLLVGVMRAEDAERESTSLLNQLGSIGDLAHQGVAPIIGGQYFNREGNGVEHFGYVDGRSQPLVLVEDIQREQAEVARDPGTVGVKAAWPHRPFPVDQFVVRDPGVDDAHAYGSYLVVRQLEQNVAAFASAEEGIAQRRPFANADTLAVGRLRDGTPVERSIGQRITDAAGQVMPVSNAFLFTTDSPRCPLFAHVRKTNPRTDAKQPNLMIRRGITYGLRPDRTVDTQGRFVLPDHPQRPSSGVGLLFQSYQASIENQFEVTQVFWANSPLRADTQAEVVGIDPIIGQPGPQATAKWPRAWGQSAGEVDKLDFYSSGQKGRGPYVKMLGGGYFFAPSLPFLQSL